MNNKKEPIMVSAVPEKKAATRLRVGMFLMAFGSFLLLILMVALALSLLGKRGSFEIQMLKVTTFFDIPFLLVEIVAALIFAVKLTKAPYYFMVTSCVICILVGAGSGFFIWLVHPGMNFGIALAWAALCTLVAGMVLKKA